MRRLGLLTIVTALAALLPAGGAVAFWGAGGIGGTALQTGTLTSPSGVSVAAETTQTVAVAWSLSAVGAGLDAEIDYTVERSADNGATWTTAAGTCAGTLDHPTMSCTDTPPQTGAYRYRVTSRFRSWSDSATSAPTVCLVDNTPPEVASIARADASPTRAGTLTWTLTFTEDVQGVDASDFDLSGIGDAAITAVSPSAATSSDTFTVTASSGSGSGSLRLDLDDDDSIVDAVGNELGGSAAGDGDFTGEAYAIDRTAPTATIERIGPQQANLDTVQWTVTFDEPVDAATVDAGDFGLYRGSGIQPASGTIVAVTATAPNRFTVTASGQKGQGALGLDLLATNNIADVLGNGPATPASAPAAQQFALDVPYVVSADRAAGQPSGATAATQVVFTVTFNEDVSGVNAADFSLSGLASIGATVASVSANGGGSFDVTINTVLGLTGTLFLDVTDDGTITDALGNVLGGSGASNGSYTGGQGFTIDRKPPALVSLEMFDNYHQGTSTSGHDGRIDRVVATFDEDLDPAGSSVTTGWTTLNRPGAVSFTAVTVPNTAGNRTANLVFTGGTAGTASTDVGTFTITLSAVTGEIRDALGNKASFTVRAPVDKAAPVPYQLTDTAGANNGRFEAGNTLTVSFTEPVTNSATSSDVVLTHASSDTLAIPGLLSGTVSTGRPGYITSGTATFAASALSQPTTNQVRVTLSTPSCSSSGCSNLSTEGSNGNVPIDPSTTIRDLATTPNVATQNTATPTFSIRLF